MTGAHLITSNVIIVLNKTETILKVKLIRNYNINNTSCIILIAYSKTHDTLINYTLHRDTLRSWFIIVSCKGLDTSASVLSWKSTSLISKTLIRILCFPRESSSMNNDEILRCVSPSLIKCYEAVIMAHTRDALVKLRHYGSWQGCKSPSIHPPPEHPPWIVWLKVH